MGHTGIFASSAECVAKMGSGKSAGFTEAMINDACAQSESYINALTGINWSDGYAACNADKKRLLSEASACLVACYGIAYDMALFTNRGDAANLLSLNWARWTECKELLTKDQVGTFLEAA